MCRKTGDESFGSLITTPLASSWPFSREVAEDILSSLGWERGKRRMQSDTSRFYLRMCEENTNSLERLISMFDSFYTRVSSTLNLGSVLGHCMFRREKASVSPAVTLTACFLPYTGTDGNMQKAPRSCL